MSRIYHNEPLQNLPVININWSSAWDKKAWTSKGQGAILEAELRGKARFCITDSKQSKERYFILHVAVKRAHKRKFDSSGKEIEPNFSETTKVSTGFLNSSYRVDPKGQTDKLTQQELSTLVGVPELDAHTGKHGGGGDGILSLWLGEAELEKMELNIGDSLRIKTDGDSPFIYSLVRLEQQAAAAAANYAGGENVGASWTDKIMTMKSHLPEDKQEPSEIDDAEWDD